MDEITDLTEWEIPIFQKNANTMLINTSHIAPIWCKGDSFEEVVGTGFFFKEYFITTGHTRIKNNGILYAELLLKDKTDLCCNKIRTIYHLNNPIVARFQNDEKQDIFDYANHEIQDIVIYKVGDTQSPYSLFEGTIEDDTLLCGFGYSYDDERQKLLPSAYEQGRVYQEIPQKMLRFNRPIVSAKNCRWFTANGFVEGNSGCPIMNGTEIYGMLLSESKPEGVPFYNIHTSEYIRTMIDIASINRPKSLIM